MAPRKITLDDLTPKPEPVPQHVVCSMCGLDWGKHGNNPGLEMCIALLKKELASRPQVRTWQSGGQVIPINSDYTISLGNSSTG